MYRSNTEHGQNNGNTTYCRNKTGCVGCTERTLVVSIYHYSFVCLRHVVQVSIHYRLCIVTVRMKVLQNGRLVRFSERLAGASVTKRATLLGVSTAAVSIVMTA